MSILEDLEHDIRRYHEAIKIDPSNAQEYRGKLEGRVKRWYEELNIIVCVAQNEQLPWLPGELELKTRPMFKKCDIGLQQVGDYQAYIDRGGKLEDNFCGVLVDRKTCADFYGTMFGNRDRFYREIDRFHKDTRFTDFYVFVECNLIDWLNYVSPGNKTGDCMINQKLGVLGSLESRGAHVVWCGNRKIACRIYRDFVRQWCLKNYNKILSIE